MGRRDPAGGGQSIPADSVTRRCSFRASLSLSIGRRLESRAGWKQWKPSEDHPTEHTVRIGAEQRGPFAVAGLEAASRAPGDAKWCQVGDDF